MQWQKNAQNFCDKDDLTQPSIRVALRPFSNDQLSIHFISTVLKPEEYQSMGMPGGYIYWPSASVFVHLSAIPPQYLDFNGLPTLPLHSSGVFFS